MRRRHPGLVEAVEPLKGPGSLLVVVAALIFAERYAVADNGFAFTLKIIAHGPGARSLAGMKNGAILGAGRGPRLKRGQRRQAGSLIRPGVEEGVAVRGP